MARMTGELMEGTLHIPTKDLEVILERWLKKTFNGATLCSLNSFTTETVREGEISYNIGQLKAVTVFYTAKMPD